QALEGVGVGGGAHVGLSGLREVVDVGELGSHDAGEAFADFFDGPVVAGFVLGPLEVADRDAAGVGEDVGDDDGAAAGEHGVGLAGDGAVGELEDDGGLDFVGVVFGD